VLSKHKNKEYLWQEKVTEGVFYVKRQNFGKGKQQSDHKNKANSDGGKKSFPPCKHRKKTIQMEKYCWWMTDTMCGDCKQLRHIFKVCKSKNKVFQASTTG